jgi:hypothetical protein
MDFLRLYLGEITSVVLVLILLFVGAAVAARYVSNRRLITMVRNICVAATVAAFAASLVFSLTVNQTPKGRIDRSGVDADQKAFEQRASDRGR